MACSCDGIGMVAVMMMVIMNRLQRRMEMIMTARTDGNNSLSGRGWNEMMVIDPIIEIWKALLQYYQF